jgi:DNA-binding HxlR family transcriptional regulator
MPAHVLRNGIEGMTQRMVTVTLRNLERDSLLVRHDFPRVPPRVEYELTPMGARLLSALEAFTDWIREHWRLIEAPRRTFDEAQSRARPPEPHAPM